MKQSRLNHLMILIAYKSQLDQIDLTEIASTFVDKNEGRRCTFIWKVLDFRFFCFVVISFMSKVYISQFFPPKMSSTCFIFHSKNNFF